MLFPDWVYRSFTRKRCLDNVLLLVFGLKNHVDLNLFFLLLFAEWKFYKPPLSWISIWRHQMSIRQMEPSCLLFNSQQSTRQLVTDSQVFRPVKLFSDETGGQVEECMLTTGGWWLPAASCSWWPPLLHLLTTTAPDTWVWWECVAPIHSKSQILWIPESADHFEFERGVKKHKSPKSVINKFLVSDLLTLLDIWLIYALLWQNFVVAIYAFFFFFLFSAGLLRLKSSIRQLLLTSF